MDSPSNWRWNAAIEADAAAPAHGGLKCGGCEGLKVAATSSIEASRAAAAMCVCVWGGGGRNLRGPTARRREAEEGVAHLREAWEGGACMEERGKDRE